MGKGYSDDTAIELGEKMAEKAQSILSPLVHERGEKPIRVLAVESNRWPFSIHIAAPDHFLDNSEVFARPLGNIYFANNNLGTPAFEEAIYRGWIAAEKIEENSLQAMMKQIFFLAELKNLFEIR